VLNTLPQSENPPNPTTETGAGRIAEELVESLIVHWDDMIGHDSTIPLLLISAPQFEDAVSRALAHPIAGKYPETLLHRIDVPRVERSIAHSPASMLPVAAVRTQVLAWLVEHTFDLLMAKPVANYGAKLERPVLQVLARGSPLPRPRLSKARSDTQDIRPLAAEVVPFDGKDGPILGLYKSGGDWRPTVLPAAGWRAQKYRPQAADERATGTIYLKLPLTRFCLEGASKRGLTSLGQWSMRPLREIASSSWQDQTSIFENALRDLMGVLKTRPLRCPPERGLRGYRQSTFP
jgi:hypothetical protein